MTDAELQARLRANMLALKALQARTTPLRVLDLPGVRALCLPGPGLPLFQQQVLYLHPNALGPALPRLEAWYREQAVEAWRVPVTPGDAAPATALAAAGYAPEGEVHALGQLLAPAPPPGLPPGLTLERPRLPDEVTALNLRCYGPGVMDFLLGWRLETTPATPLHYVLVREAGRVLAAGMAFDHEDTAGVYNVATHPDARRRGLGTLLMEALQADALERGRRAVVLQASLDGLVMYQRMGYRMLGAWTNWVRRPEAAPG